MDNLNYGWVCPKCGCPNAPTNKSCVACFCPESDHTPIQDTTFRCPICSRIPSMSDGYYCTNLNCPNMAIALNRG